MKEFHLSAQEILYLCAMRGVKEVAGVDDVFLSVPEESLAAIVSRTKDSLVEKGCLEMDFDGNFACAKETDELIDLITQSTKRIAYFGLDDGIARFGTFYAAHDAVCLSERRGDLYVFRPIAAADIPAYFASFFRDDQTRAEQDRSVTVSTKVLDAAKKLFENNRNAEAEKTLREGGVDELTAALLLASYGGRALYLSVKTDSLDPDDVFSDGLIYISDGKTAVNVGFDLFSEDDAVIISLTDAKTEKNRFLSLLDRLSFIPVEGEEA